VSSDLLVAAKQDDLHLAAAIEPRFLDLCDAYKRIKGEHIPIPVPMMKTITLWRRCLIRFKRGDFRISSSEKKACKEVAQWTVDENGLLRNQLPVTINWAL